MTVFQDMSLAQVADVIALRVRTTVKQAGIPPAPQTMPDPKSSVPTSARVPMPITDAPAADPGIAERIKAMLGNVDLSSIVGKATDAAKGFSPMSNPAHTALLGGGLGIGAGAIGALTSSDKEKRKRWLRHALFGGAMGGVGGLAIGGMRQGLEGLTTPSARERGELQKPQVPTPVERGGHVLKTLTDTMNGKSLPDMSGIKGVSKSVADTGYNAMNKVRDVANDPAAALETFRGKLQTVLDDPSSAGKSLGNTVSSGLGSVTGAIKDVAAHPDAAMQSIKDTVGKHQGALIPGGFAAGYGSAHVLNNRANAKANSPQTLAKELPSILNNPKFKAHFADMNTTLTAAGHPAVTQQQRAVAMRVPMAKGISQPPKLTAPQQSAINTAAQSFKPPGVKTPQRNRGLWGLGGAAIGAGINAAYTPHLSIEQKRQQAMVPQNFGN